MRPRRSEHGFKSLAFDDVEQFLRWAAGALVAHFPLADGGRAGIEHRGKDGLAQLQALVEKLQSGRKGD